MERDPPDTSSRGRQVALRYDAGEDRLLLTLADAAGDRRSYWLTRRLVLGLLGVLQTEARRLAAAPTGRGTARRGAGASSAAVGPAPATVDQGAPPTASIAAQLATRIRVRRPKATCILSFDAEGTPAAALALDRTALQRLGVLIATLAKRARWLGEPAGSAATGPTRPEPEPNRRLH